MNYNVDYELMVQVLTSWNGPDLTLWSFKGTQSLSSAFHGGGCLRCSDRVAVGCCGIKFAKRPEHAG